MNTQFKTDRRLRRKNRVRAKVTGTATRPRLCVFRSNTQMIVQLIDDQKGVTIATASTKQQKGGTPGERAIALGTHIAEVAKDKKISAVVFDRGGYLYTGNIKALADAAREAGLTF